jgi:glucose-6-phosphate isomerase
MPNPIRIDIAGARAEAVGSKHGITRTELKELEPEIATGHARLSAERKAGRLGFYDLYKDKAMLGAIRAAVRAFPPRNFENLVVLGIGGSALGLTTLVTALKPPHYNMRDRKGRGGFPRAFVMDNVDPNSFHSMLELCAPEKTLYNVISKSGGTAETAAQAFIIAEHLEKTLGRAAVKDHLVITTETQGKGAKPSLLHRLQKRYGAHMLDVPLNVGGRFSVFSAVGLFPAAMLGIDIGGLMSGCKTMDQRTQSTSLAKNPAYLRAALHFLAADHKGKYMAVMMPYSDALRDVSDWYRQLWAESLGKKVSRDGRNADWYAGQTPIRALGVTDQHSQLQLFLEGPNDKIVTVLEQQRFECTLPIPSVLEDDSGAEYMRKRTMAQLLDAECRATIDALREAERPVIRVRLDRVDASSIGQLLYMLEVETAMAGELFNVDAFDQPAVERIKVLTRAYLGKGR